MDLEVLLESKDILSLTDEETINIDGGYSLNWFQRSWVTVSIVSNSMDGSRWQGCGDASQLAKISSYFGRK